jgi:hypothetical protein
VILRSVIAAAVVVLVVWAVRRWIRGEGLSAVRQSIVTGGLLVLGLAIGAASAATVAQVRGPAVEESVGVIADVRGSADDLVRFACVRERGDPVVPDQYAWCGALATEVAPAVLAGEREAVIGWVSPRDVRDRIIVSVRPVVDRGG